MVSRDPEFNGQSPLRSPSGRPTPSRAGPGGKAVGSAQQGSGRRRTLRERDREGRPMLEHMKARTPELWQTWQRLDRLGRDLRTILPSVRLIPIKLDRQVLLVTAPSSAMAARLRQYEPRLVDGLQARGWLVNRVKFRPNTVFMPVPPPPRAKQPVPPRAVESMAALAASGHVTPELRAALEAFVQRQRGYLQEP